MANIANVKVLPGNQLVLSGSTVQLTGSGASLKLENSEVAVTGTLRVSGTVFANELHVDQLTQNTVVFTSGSTKFGDNPADTHEFTGSVNISGNVTAVSFAGSGSNLTDLNADNITAGVLDVSNGGTGLSAIGVNQILLGTASNAFITASLLEGPGVNIDFGPDYIAFSSTLAGGTVTAITASTGLSSSTGGPITTSGALSLDGKPLSLYNLAVTGVLVADTVSTVTARTIEKEGLGISITNGDGVSGNPTISSSATSDNVPDTIVYRDNLGGFSATNISASTLTASQINITNTTNLTDLTAQEITITEGLILDGYLSRNRVTVTANYSVLSTDQVVFVDPTSGQVTISLSGATDIDGREIIVKRIDNPFVNANPVIVSCSFNNIDDASTFGLYGPFQAITLIADSGSNKWFVV